MHPMYNTPFIPLEKMNFFHQDTKQKLNSLQEKISSVYAKADIIVLLITSLEVSKET